MSFELEAEIQNSKFITQNLFLGGQGGVDRGAQIRHIVRPAVDRECRGVIDPCAHGSIAGL
jgi:hypothetical protein